MGKVLAFGVRPAYASPIIHPCLRNPAKIRDGRATVSGLAPEVSTLSPDGHLLIGRENPS